MANSAFSRIKLRIAFFPLRQASKVITHRSLSSPSHSAEYISWRRRMYIYTFIFSPLVIDVSLISAPRIIEKRRMQNALGTLGLMRPIFSRQQLARERDARPFVTRLPRAACVSILCVIYLLCNGTWGSFFLLLEANPTRCIHRRTSIYRSHIQKEAATTHLARLCKRAGELCVRPRPYSSF